MTNDQYKGFGILIAALTTALLRKRQTIPIARVVETKATAISRVPEKHIVMPDHLTIQ